jgi:hypothetical protein
MLLMQQLGWVDAAAEGVHCLQGGGDVWRCLLFCLLLTSEAAGSEHSTDAVECSTRKRACDSAECVHCLQGGCDVWRCLFLCL